MTRRPILFGALPALVTLAFVGSCSTDADPEASGSPDATPTQTQEPAEEPTETETADPDSTDEDSADDQTAEPSDDATAGDMSLPIAAGHFAQEQVSESVVVQIDLEEHASTWEIDLIGPDGKEYEITVSSDGTEIVRALDEDSTTDAERTRNMDVIGRATVNFEEALEIAAKEFPSASLDELDLEEDNEVLHWEVGLDDTDGVAKEFNIDAATGEVLNQR